LLWTPGVVKHGEFLVFGCSIPQRKANISSLAYGKGWFKRAKAEFDPVTQGALVLNRAFVFDASADGQSDVMSVCCLLLSIEK